MTVSSHQRRSTQAHWSFSSVRFHRLFATACRIALISIAATSIFISQAMATDAVDREHAIEIAKQQNGGIGKVLGVSTSTDSDGNIRFSVKLISNGRVRVFTINRAP